MTLSGVAVLWPSTSIGPPGAAITSDPSRVTEKLCSVPAGVVPPNTRMASALSSCNCRRSSPRRNAPRLSSPSASSAFRPAALLFDFSPRMAASLAPVCIPRDELAGLAALQIAHRDGVAGLDVDEDRAVAAHLVALHAGRQRDLAGPQDDARPRWAGGDGGVGRLAHHNPVVGETSLPACEIILAARIGSKVRLCKATRRATPQASAR